MLVGHRGARGEKPENTLLGFQYASDLNLGAIELDIHCSADDYLVVIHDETVERTTNGQGHVDKMPLTELKKLDAGLGESIPTLEEVFNLYSKNTLEIMVEIKSSKCEKKLIDLVNKFSFRDRVIVKSFNHRFLKTVRELDDQIRIFPLIYGLPLNPIGIIESVRGQGLSLSINTVDKEIISDCKNNSFRTCVWNANNIEELKLLESWGVDYICTDLPDKITQASS